MSNEDTIPTPEANALMVGALERIADVLDRVLIGIYVSAGLLAFISFVLVLRLMIGR